MADDHPDLRASFDSAADLYQQARPDYPDELYETLLRVTGLKSGARVLEIGCRQAKRRFLWPIGACS